MCPQIGPYHSVLVAFQHPRGCLVQLQEQLLVVGANPPCIQGDVKLRRFKALLVLPP